MRYVLSTNQNLFDAIQHGDVFKMSALNSNNTFDGLDEPVTQVVTPVAR